MNHGTPQQQDPRAPQQAWPSFMDGPTPLVFSAQIVEQQHVPVDPQQAPIPAPPQPWGLAAPQQPYAHPQPVVQQYSGYALQQSSPQQLVQPHHPQMPVAVPGGGFAFPTPDGLQVVQQPQPGGLVTSTGIAAHPPVAPKQSAASTAKGGRLRWEVIVPAGTALVLIVAAFVVFTNFDRITGTATSADSAASTEPADAAEGNASATDGSGSDADAAPETAPQYSPGDVETAPEPTLDAAQAREAVAKAKQLIKLGRYDEATATLAPLVVAGGGTPPVVGRMQQQIAAKSKRNDQLLAQLGKQRQAGAWADVLRTLGSIQGLHPLSDAQAKLAATAATKLKPAGGGVAAAKPAKATGSGRGATVAKVPSVARPATAPVSPGSNASTSGGGAAASGGSTPPTAGSAGAAPAQPSVANPSSAPTSPIIGQPAGGADDCGAHDNMVMHAGHC